MVLIEEDGSLGPRSDLVDLPGEPGRDRKQQASSHPHNAVFDSGGRFIAVPDKGLDRAFVFRLDAASGKLTPNDPPFVATRAGAGPRHIAFHSQMPLAYVINELGSSVTTYRFDPQRGSLQPIQILPSVPASYTGNNTGAEIAVTPSGRVVYASNRGHDSVAIFSVDRRDGTWRRWAGRRPTRSHRAFLASIRPPKSSMQPIPTRASAISRTPTRSAVQDQPGERDADACRSGHQDQQPVHDRLRPRLELGLLCPS